jgi:hypothetical protein
VGTTQHDRGQQAREPDVIYVDSGPGNQPRIFATLDPFANKFGNHGHRSRPRSGSLPGTQLDGGVLNRIDDVLIAGAAAEINSSASRISASDGLCVRLSSSAEAMIIPGVQ